MRISIFYLLRQSFSIIKKDRIILAPTLIVSLMVFLFQPKESVELLLKPNPPLSLVIFWGGLCLVQLFVYCLVIVMAQAIYKEQGVLIKEVLGRVLRKSVWIIVLTLLVMLGMGVSFAFFSFIKLPSLGLPLLNTIAGASIQVLKVGVVVLALLGMAFLPQILLLENQNPFKALKTFALYFRYQFSNIIFLSLLIFNIQLVFAVVGLGLSQIPGFGELLASVVSALGDVTIFVSITLFYMLTRPPITV